MQLYCQKISPGHLAAKIAKKSQKSSRLFLKFWFLAHFRSTSNPLPVTFLESWNFENVKLFPFFTVFTNFWSVTVRIDSVSYHLALEWFLTIFWHGDPWLLIEFICHKSIEIQMSNRKTVHNYVLSHLDAFWPMKINCFDWSLNRRKTTFIDHNIKILLLPHDFRETRSPNCPVYQTPDRFTCPPVGCRWWARKRFGFFSRRIFWLHHLKCDIFDI